MENKIIVVSVGGSLIVPSEIDISFLKKFRKLVLRYVKKGMRFIIICGGGKTARQYQEAAKKIKSTNRLELTNQDIDWLGIWATKINAYLVKTIFKKEAHEKIIENPTEKVKFKEKILVASGWKPGFSTDYDAVLLAKNFNAKRIINLTNVDYVYNKDPSKFKDAKPIKEICWKEFRKMLPKKWIPGMNVPFDPVAAKEAEKLKLEVAIINGRKLKNFEECIKKKPFTGTVIK